MKNFDYDKGSVVMSIVAIVLSIISIILCFL